MDVKEFLSKTAYSHPKLFLVTLPVSLKVSKKTIPLYHIKGTNLLILSTKIYLSPTSSPILEYLVYTCKILYFANDLSKLVFVP